MNTDNKVAPNVAEFFDDFFEYDKEYRIDNFFARALYTPDCTTHLMDSCVFVRDTSFRPNHGTARADFPVGRVPEFYDFIKSLLMHLNNGTSYADSDLK